MYSSSKHTSMPTDHPTTCLITLAWWEGVFCGGSDVTVIDERMRNSGRARVSGHAGDEFAPAHRVNVTQRQVAVAVRDCRRFGDVSPFGNPGAARYRKCMILCAVLDTQNGKNVLRHFAPQPEVGGELTEKSPFSTFHSSVDQNEICSYGKRGRA